MIVISWMDRSGKNWETPVDAVKLWEARGGSRDHPDGTIIEGYRNGYGVIQLDADDRIGSVLITEEELV